MHKLLWLLCGLCFGCGDPLVNDQYLGEPLFELSGMIAADGSVLAAGRMQVALFWAREGENNDLQQSVVPRASFPTTYSLSVYTPPVAEAIRPVPAGQGDWAVARVLVYSDVDGDNAWSPFGDELVLGGNNDFLLAYVPVSAQGGRLTAPLAAGYQVVQKSACGPSGTTLTPVPPSTSVPLWVTLNFLAANPLDVDCDGSEDDPCIGFLDALHHSNDPQIQAMLRAEYEQCVAQP